MSSVPRPTATRRILIVDSHPLVRRGLTALFAMEPDLTVCAAVATPRAALEAITSSRLDLAIVDSALADGKGLALVRDIRSAHPNLPILVLGMHDAPSGARRAIQAGANAYTSKQEVGEAHVAAVRSVLGGQSHERPRLGPAGPT